MKKFLMLMATSLLFVACTTTDVKEDESHSFNYAGLLEPIEVSVWQYGTHTLTTTEGEFYAVKSDNIDLNKYNNKDVLVDGELISGYPLDSGPEFLDIKDIQAINK